MANLRELTDKHAVDKALREFVDLGRDEFIRKYRQNRAHDYFVPHEGQLVDSKPLLSVAFGYQFPDLGPLPVSTFRGGPSGAVKALTRLGYAVVTRAQLRPPEIGVTYANRTAIYEAFGGDKVSGIMRFPGDTVVNVFSDAQGPYTDDAPSLTEPFGYRGEGLNGPQRVEVGGNALLQDAMTERRAVRFWYRPQGGSFSFVSWVGVLGRAWVSGIGQDKAQRPEIEWNLQTTADPSASNWPDSLLLTIEESIAAGSGSRDDPEARAESTYKDLVNRVERRGQQRRKTGVVRADYPRSIAAREAVLIRSAGKCESWCCTGMPPETNRRGDAILDVDHIIDLALGGEDHPRNMAALCPNCHASKTRGANRRKWRVELLKVTTEAHSKSMQ